MQRRKMRRKMRRKRRRKRKCIARLRPGIGEVPTPTDGMMKALMAEPTVTLMMTDTGKSKIYHPPSKSASYTLPTRARAVYW
jgi:hypothetical protein